jgi:hypothetical protein
MRNALTSVLGWAVVALVLATGYVLADMGRQGAPLVTASAPRGGLDLQLAPDMARAGAILGEWQASGRRRFADQLERDRRLIALYTALLVGAIAWGALRSGLGAGLSGRVALAGVLVAAAAAGFDLRENERLAALLREPVTEAAVVAARRAAQLKFVCLLFASLVALAFTGAGWRHVNARRLERAARRTFEDEARADGLPPPAAPPAAADGQAFERLIDDESDAIFRARNAGPDDKATRRVPPATTSEPWVTFRSADVVGLALSGGGIRSATFNLGVLQQLHECGVLRLVDYLSTVSGGGYVGGFWSAWLHRARGTHAAQAGPAPSSFSPEPAEVRHLREFSGFLVPRSGLFEAEMWRAVAAVVAGLVPALVIALAVLALVVIAWLTLTFSYASSFRALDARVSPAVFSMVTAFLLLVAFEHWWRAADPAHRVEVTCGPAPAAAAAGPTSVPWWLYGLWAGGAALLGAAIQLRLPELHEARLGHAFPVWTGDWTTWAFRAAAGSTPYVAWWDLMGLNQAGRHSYLSPRLFDFAVCWGAVALLMVFARLVPEGVGNRWKRESVSGFDRVIMRLLALAAGWTFLAALWHVCVNAGWAKEMLIPTIASGSAFAALRNWLPRIAQTSKGGWLAHLAPVLPQLLAYLTLLLAVAGVGAALIAANRDDWLAWWTTTALASLVVVLALFIEPDRFGLHAFYRDRLGRAFIGARHVDNPGRNRGTEFRDSDDVLMHELPARPLHLVCCAVNDLRGDTVETFARGARSATLSRFGLTVAGCHAQRPHVTLSAAVTASAAAFNSNMGSLSAKLGPAVSFLMTALNLRLGLWERHPAAGAPGTRGWPGLLLYREMFGLTSATPHLSQTEPPRVAPMSRDVHLSDGGHFENLALYELVRRHCRYIILSDCGADPTVAFDDLGNALRRIREDFGVDVEIDVSPLRPDPATGHSQQHVAIGSIRYSNTDRGILIYLKPTLTGDEPSDVCQYRTRNTAFPHESTADQFYDEAQWESYRRLGQHAVERVFDFVKEHGLGHDYTADRLFANAQLAWFPTPAGLRDDVLAMTARFGQVENDLRTAAASRLVEEAFPEIALMKAGDDGAPARPARDAAPAPPGEVSATDLSFMLRLTQTMEDVWIGCQLDRHWGHPLNMGWVNLFARWTSSPTFRSWWPLLAPMYTPGFVRFMRLRLNLHYERWLPEAPPSHPHGRRPGLVGHAQPPEGLAKAWWESRAPEPPPWKRPAPPPDVGVRYYPLEVIVGDAPAGARPQQVGLTAVRSRGRVAAWSSDDFFVPPSLWGAGFGGLMLADLLDTLSEGHDTCYVVVHAPAGDADNRIARTDERAFVEQYRACHFQQLHDSDARRARVREMGFALSPEDTVLFREWTKDGARRQAPALPLFPAT